MSIGAKRLVLTLYAYSSLNKLEICIPVPYYKSIMFQVLPFYQFVYIRMSFKHCFISPFSSIFSGIAEKFPEKYKSVVVRLKGFHIIEDFLGALGSFIKGSGLEEFFTESDLCLRGTANKILAGKDYYKMIRCNSIMCEALINLIWNAFVDWYTVEFNDQSHLVNLYININILQQCLLLNDTWSCEINRNTESVLPSLDKLLPS